MRLDHHLVLTRWLHSLLGAEDIDEIKGDLRKLEPGADGETPYLRALLERDGVQLGEDRLREYDARIRSYESRLAQARGSFSWKYFQYLALLHTEILLDGLSEDPAEMVRGLNDFLAELRKSLPHLTGFPAFQAGDLRRLALFMATGSGKTLLMHANLWQVFHYLEHGRHPEALVRRPDGRSHFDNVILVTPKEGLSEQHLREFRRSGIDAVHLAYEEPTGWLFGPQVRVIEISKLAEEVSGDGLSIALESLGSHNLVFVDEGHKGVGSEAREWKNRQQSLSRNGFLLEYSATFAQSVAAAPNRARRDLLTEYGKSIAFDYSYRHFYDDGYGKHFEVLNLQSDQTERAHELLVGGLLTFFQQVHLFDSNRDELHPYRIERPLWVFLGAGVVKTGRRDLSDVATVIVFLQRFLEEPEWAVDAIGRGLRGESGFNNDEGEDLFSEGVQALEGFDPGQLYEEILSKVFHGRGALELWELKEADGEIGLRTSTPDSAGARYFGLINVGDSGALRRHLEREAGFDVMADEFTPSLFPEVDVRESPVNILVGSRKFIEGWSSWRVSSMGLLNMGRGEGPQVIQLFGRGVRLKGKEWSLRRSTRTGQGEEALPAGLRHLETLYIFGWNADYVQAFRKMMTTEEVGWELEVPVEPLFDPLPELWVPEPARQDAAQDESWALEEAPIHIRLDLTPRVTSISGDDVQTGSAGRSRLLDFSDPAVAGLVDQPSLYLGLLEYKEHRRYRNLMIRPEAVTAILRQCDVTVLDPEADDPERVQEGAYRAATKYMDRFYALRERESESQTMRPTRLQVREKSTRPYRVRGTDTELREAVLALVNGRDELLADGGEPLPRLHLDRHLFSPLLLDPRGAGVDLAITPTGLKPGESSFLGDLRDFWRANHSTDSYRDADLYLLRNLPHSGVGFFRNSGFYPDFILWVERAGDSLIQFLEPHGMHHGGLEGNGPKIDALKELERLSEEDVFKSEGIRMAGYILTETDRDQIPDVGERSWDDLRRDFRILPQKAGDYVETILAG